jgi:hypothetical protein
MTDPSNFAKLVPGFDFLQGLVKNAGSAMPGIGQWVAPTLNPEELGKRIEELRTVQFWLEQNARMLGATIQALEVQRMTLSTLKTMNVQMSDLRDSLLIPVPMPVAEPVATPAAAAEAPAPEKPKSPTPAAAAAAASVPPAGVDPMQWWGALTKQFTELAAAAMKDGGAGAAQEIAGAMLKPLAAAGASVAPQRVPKPAAKAARKAAPRKRSGA